MAPTKEEENNKGKYRFVRRDGQLLHGEEAEEESANVFADEVLKEIKDKQREKNRLLRLRHPAYGKETSSVSQDTDGVLIRHSTKDNDGEERKTSRKLKPNISAHAVRKRVLSAKKRGVSTEVDDQMKAYATGLNAAALTADIDMASLTFSPQATAAATGLEATVLTAEAHGSTMEADVQAKADVKGAEVVAGNVDVRAVDEHVFVGAEALVTGADVKVGNASVAAVKVETRAGATFEAKALEVTALNVDAAGVRVEADVGVYVGVKAVEVSALNTRVSGTETKVEARAGVELALLKVGGFNHESDTENHAPMLDLTLLDLRVPGKGGATTVRAGGGAGSSSNSGADNRSSTRKKGAQSKAREGPVAGGNSDNGTGMTAKAGAKAKSKIEGLNVNGNNTKVSPEASGNTKTHGSETNTGGRSKTTSCCTANEEKLGNAHTKSSLKENDVELRPVVPKDKTPPQAIHVIPTSFTEETRQDGDKTSGHKNRTVISQNHVSSHVPRKDSLGRTPTLRHTAVAKGNIGHHRGGRTDGNIRLQDGAVIKDDDLSLYELHQHRRPFQLPSITRETSQTQSINRAGKSRHEGDRRLKGKTNRDANAKDSGREKQRWLDGSDQRTTKKPLTANRGRRTPASSQPKMRQTTGKQYLERAERAQRGAIEPQTTTSGEQPNGRHARLNKTRTPVGRAPRNEARRGVSKSAAKGKRGNPESSTTRSKLPPLTFNDRVLNKVASEADRDPTPRSQPSRPRSKRSSASKFQTLDREALRNRLLQKYAPSPSTATFDKTGTIASEQEEDKTEETVVVKKKPTGLNKNIHGFDTLGMETSKGVKRLGRNIHGFGS